MYGLAKINCSLRTISPMDKPLCMQYVYVCDTELGTYFYLLAIWATISLEMFKF